MRRFEVMVYAPNGLVQTIPPIFSAGKDAVVDVKRLEMLSGDYFAVEMNSLSVVPHIQSKTTSVRNLEQMGDSIQPGGVLSINIGLD